MPGTVEGRLGQLEQRAAAVAQQIADISRTLDRVIPYGEALAEIRATQVGLREDLSELRLEAASIRLLAVDNEKQRQQDVKDQRSLQYKLAGGLGVAVISAVGGILAAGVGPT
jgi:hypothetical protein